MATKMDAERIAARSAEIAAMETRRLVERTPKSEALHRRALKSLPNGVASNFQAGDPYPIYLERGSGSHVWDVDGAEYVDCHGGFGVNVVGHAHPKIAEAIVKAARSGTHFAVSTQMTVALAEQICERFNLEQMRFVNSGTEATMDAVRVARAATSRDRIVKMEGSYHGHHDSVLFSVVPESDVLGLRQNITGESADAEGTAYTTQPTSKGIPRSQWQDTIIVPFNDARAFQDVCEEHGDQIAAIIMEPVMMNVGIVVPDPGYLERVREICNRFGVIFIYDEVKSGATIAYGGAIERYGVQPDLACFAKAIGGGTTVGAFGGKASVMDYVTKGAAQQGTFNGNPLGAAAGYTALTEVLTRDAYKEFARLGTILAEGCRAAIAETGVEAHAVDLGAKGCVSYRAEPMHNYRDFLEAHAEFFYASYPWMVNRGVFMTPGDEEQWTLSVQHTDEDIQRYIDSFGEFCAELTK